jgi:hypothetical protein
VRMGDFDEAGEAIAGFGDGFDDGLGFAGGGEGFAEEEDVLGEGLFGDVCEGPDAVEEFLLGEVVGGGFDEEEQEIEGLWGKRNASIASGEETAIGVESESAERQKTRVPPRGPLRHGEQYTPDECRS